MSNNFYIYKPECDDDATLDQNVNNWIYIEGPNILGITRYDNKESQKDSDVAMLYISDGVNDPVCARLTYNETSDKWINTSIGIEFRYNVNEDTFKELVSEKILEFNPDKNSLINLMSG